MALLSLVSGTNVQTQFVDQLGTDWVTYMSPVVGGGDALATVVLNQPKDAKTFRRSMISLASAANSTIALQTKKKSSGIQLKIERATRDDVDRELLGIAGGVPGVDFKRRPVVSHGISANDRRRGPCFAGRNAIDRRR